MTLHKQIAESFAALLKAELGPRFEEMRAKNQTPEYLGTMACASHDFIDSNMVMDAAFLNVIGRESWLTSDLEESRCSNAGFCADNALWNAAWNYARANQLI